MSTSEIDWRGTPRQPLSREEVAQLEVGHTTISPGLARALTMFFLAAILLVTAVQHVRDLLQWRAGQRPSPVPQLWDILRSGRDAVHTWRWSTLPLADRVVAVNRGLLRESGHYDDRLEEESWLAQRV
jgi:hypothetical protein